MLCNSKLVFITYLHVLLIEHAFTIETRQLLRSPELHSFRSGRKFQNFFRCWQVWSWGQPWRFNLMDCNLLSIRNWIFGGMILNEFHRFKHILVHVAWCFIVFSALLFLVWGFTRFINLFPIVSTVTCRILSNYTIKESILFLGMVIFVIIYIVISENSLQ